MIRLWLFVIFAFLLLIGAWSSFIWIASKHSPQVIKVETTHPR